MGEERAVGGGRGKPNETPHFKVYHHDPAKPHGLSDRLVLTLYQDRNQQLWVGTSKGLNLRDTQSDPDDLSRFHVFRHRSGDPTSLSNDAIVTLTRDSVDRLWIGTDGGLNLLHSPGGKVSPATARFTHYRVKDGLPNDVIYGILEDDAGFLWLSTNRGLSRFDPSNETFKNFDSSDGLQHDEFNTGAYCKGPDGKMYFGGINGFNAFFPDQIVEDRQAPQVVFTNFLLFNKSVPFGRPAPQAKSNFVLESPLNSTKLLTLS